MHLRARILKGDVQAAMLMRGIEDERPDALETLEAVYTHTGGTHVIGLTGPPGVGMSP